MVAGTTSDDLYVLDAVENFAGTGTKGRIQYFAFEDAPLQHLDQTRWLLVDFFQHVVTVATLGGRLRAEFGFTDRTVDDVALFVEDHQRVRTNIGKITLFKIDKAARHQQQGRCIGGDEMFTQADANHQRTAAARRNHSVRVLHRHHAQRIGALEIGHRVAYRLKQVTFLAQIVFDLMHRHFGVGIRGEAKALGQLPFAQVVMILDDAVVHNSDRFVTNMGVRVRLGRLPVRCPPRMRNTGEPSEWRLLQRVHQRLHLADTPHTLETLRAVDYRNTGRIVTPVFQPT